MNDSDVSYIVKVKNGAGWRHFDTARLQISVGQSYHEDKKFAATIDWVSSRFDKVIICVNDSLQRFNIRFETGAPEQICETTSRHHGDNWLRRNQDVISSLPNYEIYRWDEWKRDPQFQQTLARIQNLYETQPDMQTRITADIEEFWARREKRLGVSEDFRKPTFDKLSTAYFLEETAVYFLMEEKDSAVDIYPGSSFLPCELYGLYGPGTKNIAPLAPEGFTRIDFLRKIDAKKAA